MRIGVLNRQSKPASDDLVREAAQAALQAANESGEVRPPDTTARADVVLVDEAAIAALNRTHLGRAEPTDVLAFPGDEEDEDGSRLLGEVVVCVDVVRRQSLAFGHSADAELAEVVAHGILHLLGYDDATPAGRHLMARLQRRALAILRQRGALPE
ncbi:MAG: rRNA maturation RNase YbeY [Armatimonadota bacterium]